MEQSRGGQRETDGVASLAGGTPAGRVRRDWSPEKKASLYPSYFQRLGDTPTLLRDGLSEHDDVEPEICSWLVLPPFQRRTKILQEHKHFSPLFSKMGFSFKIDTLSEVFPLHSRQTITFLNPKWNVQARL